LIRKFLYRANVIHVHVCTTDKTVLLNSSDCSNTIHAIDVEDFYFNVCRCMNITWCTITLINNQKNLRKNYDTLSTCTMDITTE